MSRWPFALILVAACDRGEAVWEVPSTEVETPPNLDDEDPTDTDDVVDTDDTDTGTDTVTVGDIDVAFRQEGLSVVFELTGDLTAEPTIQLIRADNDRQYAVLTVDQHDGTYKGTWTPETPCEDLSNDIRVSVSVDAGVTWTDLTLPYQGRGYIYDGPVANVVRADGVVAVCDTDNHDEEGYLDIEVMSPGLWNMHAETTDMNIVLLVGPTIDDQAPWMEFQLDAGDDYVVDIPDAGVYSAVLYPRGGELFYTWAMWPSEGS